MHIVIAEFFFAQPLVEHRCIAMLLVILRALAHEPFVAALLSHQKLFALVDFHQLTVIADFRLLVQRLVLWVSFIGQLLILSIVS